MRQYKYKQVETYISLFRKLNEAVFVELNEKNGEAAKASEYLQTAQQKAIDLGTFIEEEEGLGHPTVSVLEEFCEVLYDINEEILSERGLAASSARARLDSIVNKIERSAASEIKITRLIVFLPYKASMWDSLESVWMAADADENCRALVIPIPYFDKNPDGSVKEYHYEGDQYPKNVPITDFESFDFGKEHPDEIYIHNPYDDMNYVTSIHPFFYSKELKKFTEKLVYIPYFVLDDPDVENEAALEHIKGFAITKGVINADEVIVQSEVMKTAYVKVLTEHFGEDTKATWENKIKGTGSPKYDKLKRMKKEEQEIPEEWKKIIKKPDGSDKKIILYNTGVVAMLNQEQKMIDKINDVLRIFKENKDEVVLWWRPHPLIAATIDSMVPSLAEQYRKIVADYKSEGWGIYDDTADMDRALVVSDAYYGDGSSMVQLYKELGKPIMLQNVDVLEKEKV